MLKIFEANPELLLQVSMKLMEMKKEYMEDVRAILNTNVAERVAPLLKEYNGHLLDKTTLLFQDIPKTKDSPIFPLNEELSILRNMS